MLINRNKTTRSQGFTLVEMLVIAPILILMIGGFVALLIRLTGEALEARAVDTITYSIQDSLTQIQNDVQLSSALLAENDIDISSTGQGYGDTTTSGSTVNFNNISNEHNAIILRETATDTARTSQNDTIPIFRANAPNSCSNFDEYMENSTMQYNVVYFISNNTLWRRTIMPSDYANASSYCATPWQKPSCVRGYDSGYRPFCQIEDEALAYSADGLSLEVNYFTTPGGATAVTAANSTGYSASARNTTLESIGAVEVTLTMTKNVNGEYVTRSQTLRSSRPVGESAPSGGGGGGGGIADGAAIQTITDANCPSTRTRAVDARDSHTYWVQRLADGNCWMLTNLGYAGGGTNTYGDVKTLSNGTGGSPSFTTAYYYVVPSTTNFTTEPTSPSIATNGTGQYGYLYNWCAAMGAQATAACANASTPAVNTGTSICPAGWRITSLTDVYDLNVAVNSGSTTSDAGLRTGALAQYSGYWYSAFGDQGVSGIYWLDSQATAGRADYLAFQSGAVATDNEGKDGGLAVRCVAN